MSINRDTVKYVAHLARIDLEPEELDKLTGQFKGILDFIGKLSEIDIKGINPTSHILPLSNILRDDVRAPSLPAERALENAPKRDGNFFEVPKVIE